MKQAYLISKYLYHECSEGSICHEMMKDRKTCPNCSCGDCIRMWLGRKRGKE